jgi:hypothetical protein
LSVRHNLGSFKFLANVGEKKRFRGSAPARNSQQSYGSLHRRAASVTIMSVALVHTSP